MVDRSLDGPARVNCQLIERSKGLQKRSRAGLAMVNATRLREDERAEVQTLRFTPLFHSPEHNMRLAPCGTQLDPPVACRDGQNSSGSRSCGITVEMVIVLSARLRARSSSHSEWSASTFLSLHPA
jgi:hypothetical protein